jgi:hypothetical protein
MKYPNFFVVGVAKAGTTSLYHMLGSHPEIYLTPIKETNYFARKDLDFDNFRPDFKHNTTIDVGKYIQEGMSYPIHCANVIETRHYLALYQNVKEEKALGEICNSYIFCPKAMGEIYLEFPQAKIIVMLRNPIERAFSGYIMNLREGKILSDSFLEEIKKDEQLEVVKWGETISYLKIGLYYEQIKRIFQYFPKEQVRIYLYDDYKTDKKSVMRDMYSFLEVDDTFFPASDKIVNEAGLPRYKYLNYFIAQTGFLRKWARSILGEKGKKLASKMMYSNENIPKISEEERSYLSAYYKEDVEKLSNLLNRDLKDWLSV